MSSLSNKAQNTFTLLISREHEAHLVDWPAINEEIRIWGQENNLAIMDPSGLKTGEGQNLFLQIRPASQNILSILADLHKRIYELSVNLELTTDAFTTFPPPPKS